MNEKNSDKLIELIKILADKRKCILLGKKEAKQRLVEIKRQFIENRFIFLATGTDCRLQTIVFYNSLECKY